MFEQWNSLSEGFLFVQAIQSPALASPRYNGSTSGAITASAASKDNHRQAGYRSKTKEDDMPIKRERPSLLQQVRAVLKSLATADRGWVGLLQAHGLNIAASNLERELSRPLSHINRNLAGFEDFALEGQRGIEPGKPAWSLLYHALASPRVLMSAPGRRLCVFPTPAQIEAVENYVFGCVPPSIQDLRVRADDAPLAIVVYAYEYRPAINTVHQKHADVCFSRTGISRVGTRGARYVPEMRGFSPEAQEPNQVCVLPCRFVAYIAAQRYGNHADFGPLRFKAKSSTDLGDGQRHFWVPIHKVFDGDECIRERDIRVELAAYHFNEKIRRIHLALAQQGFPTGWHEPELSQPPFRFTDGLADFSSKLEDGSWLLVPCVHKNLVEPATHERAPNPHALLTYRVPPNTSVSSSFEIHEKKSGARGAPEYVHARHEIDKQGNLIDLNDFPDIVEKVRRGGYDALHYKDFTGDGWIEVKCEGLALDLPRRFAAYSLIAAPDFYPYIKQLDLMKWVEQSVPPDIRPNIWLDPPGAPTPLCDDRIAADLSLEGSGFQRTDDTMTAIIGFQKSGSAEPTRVDPSPPRVSCLPDKASGIFAPGWDCSLDRTEESEGSGDKILPGVSYLANYGLGSPFPEDAKLCAALAAFWPSASPDITRSFGPANYAIVTPLTDDITGQTGGAPWDGIPGPELSSSYPGEIIYSSYPYGDWVEAALNQSLVFAALANTSVVDYERRTLIMARVFEALGASAIDQKMVWGLFSFRRVDSRGPRDEDLDEAQSTTGKSLHLDDAYRFLMFQSMGSRLHPTQFDKRLVKYDEMYTVYADLCLVLFRAGNKVWKYREF
jgi:hypothetical protein